MDPADTAAELPTPGPEAHPTSSQPTPTEPDAVDASVGDVTTDLAEVVAVEPETQIEPENDADAPAEAETEADTDTPTEVASGVEAESEPATPEGTDADAAVEATTDAEGADPAEAVETAVPPEAEAVVPDTTTVAAAPAPAPSGPTGQVVVPPGAAARGADSAIGAEPPPGSPAALAGLRSGQMVMATVLQVTADEVVVTLPDGAAGVIGKRHLSANGQVDPTAVVSPGDEVEAAVLVRDDAKGRIVLSRAWALKQRAWEKIEAAFKAHTPVTGLVTGQVKGGLVVDVGTRAFLPASHVDLHHVDDLAPFIGQPIEAVVAEADRGNDKIVLSRRNLLRQHERAKAGEFAATLQPGQVHRGRVSLLTDFGAFVDIAGVRGLVHLSELSWSRVERAGDVVSVGDDVEVKVLGVKPGKKLSLSMRALSADPLTSLREGEILPGVVTRLADFGAFVRVGSGAEGLVHVTELAEYRVHAPEEVVAPGDEVLVKVLRVDKRRRRLDLSVNQAVLHQ